MNNQTLEETAIASDVDARKEFRYPCVGMPLLYSPSGNACADDLAQCLNKATTANISLSGLAFDIEQPMCAGDKILVLLEKSEKGAYDELKTEVRWCRELSPGQYRVGIAIDDLIHVTKNQFNMHFSAFIDTCESPKEIDARCPTCEQQTTFSFVEYQPVLAGRGKMPLYDCSLCGSTRSLPGIMNNSRK